MIYKQFKDIKLSRLGMGNMRLPLSDPNDKNSPIDRKLSFQIIDTALENGINYFDTAYVYNQGDSEKVVGEALSRHPRDSYFLATKFNYGANPNYEEVFSQQLERLKTDHIDFYLLHCLMDSNIDTYLGCGCIDFFERMKKEGKIRYLGFSSHASVATLRRFALARYWDFAQIQMNYLDWEFSTTKEEYDILTTLGIPVMVMESVRGGRLSDLNEECNARLKAVQPSWSISSWAFRWLMGFDNTCVLLSGMSNMEQMKDNLSTFSAENALTAEQSSLLIDVVHDFKKSFTVPCTACRYCTKTCPVGLEIPDLLKVYNDAKYNRWWSARSMSTFSEDKYPSKCIGCNTCKEHCPQGIDIPLYLQKLAKMHESGQLE